MNESKTPVTDAAQKISSDYHCKALETAAGAELLERLSNAESRLEVENAKEVCKQCSKQWNPSLIESGTCVFCQLTAANQRLEKLESELKEQTEIKERSQFDVLRLMEENKTFRAAAKACEDCDTTLQQQLTAANQRADEAEESHKALTSWIGAICIHHNDKERSGTGCPICLTKDRDALAAKVKELEKELEMHRTHITQSRCAVNGQKGGAK